jgi:hypothetical protein
MKQMIGAALLCVLFAHAGEAQQPGGPPPDAMAKKEIGAASAAVGRAIESKDTAALEKLWSPQMLVNSPANRVLNRTEVFQAIREGKLEYPSIKTEIESFQIIGDIGIMMGHQIFVEPAGLPKAGTTRQRRFTNVWQHVNGSWIQIARQATEIDLD